LSQTIDVTQSLSRPSGGNHVIQLKKRKAIYNRPMDSNEKITWSVQYYHWWLRRLLLVRQDHWHQVIPLVWLCCLNVCLMKIQIVTLLPMPSCFIFHMKTVY